MNWRHKQYLQQYKSKRMSKIKELNDQLNLPDQEEPNEQLFQTKQIKGTPFNILKKDNTFTLTLGNNLMTPAFETEFELLTYIEENKWNLTVTLIMIISERIKEIETKKNQ